MFNIKPLLPKQQELDIGFFAMFMAMLAKIPRAIANLLRRLEAIEQQIKIANSSEGMTPNFNLPIKEEIVLLGERANFTNHQGTTLQTAVGYMGGEAIVHGTHVDDVNERQVTRIQCGDLTWDSHTDVPAHGTIGTYDDHRIAPSRFWVHSNGFVLLRAKTGAQQDLLFFNDSLVVTHIIENAGAGNLRFENLDNVVNIIKGCLNVDGDIAYFFVWNIHYEQIINYPSAPAINGNLPYKLLTWNLTTNIRTYSDRLIWQQNGKQYELLNGFVRVDSTMYVTNYDYRSTPTWNIAVLWNRGNQIVDNIKPPFFFSDGWMYDVRSKENHPWRMTGTLCRRLLLESA